MEHFSSIKKTVMQNVIWFCDKEILLHKVLNLKSVFLHNIVNGIKSDSNFENIKIFLIVVFIS